MFASQLSELFQYKGMNLNYLTGISKNVSAYYSGFKPEAVPTDFKVGIEVEVEGVRGDG